MEALAAVPPKAEKTSHTILVVDDTDLNRRILTRLLEAEGFEVVSASCGDEALSILETTPIHLALLDMLMPGMSGLDLCKRMKTRPCWEDIPVIFITAVQGAEHVAEAMEAGAVDYIAKPFNKIEILARVRTHLRLYDALLELERLNRLALDANPLSGLPGNNSIQAALDGCLARRASVTVVYADLDNFKAYNDVYGYLKGDEALLMLAGLLNEKVNVCRENPDHFLGHVGGDDFVLVLPDPVVEKTAYAIATGFDAQVSALYSPEDLARGGIRTKDRKGTEEFFPLMTLSMGGVPLRLRSFTHVQELASACAEVKRRSKQIEGSSLYMDNRHD